VSVDGVQLGYRIVGSGPPLVMIPGFAFTMADWDPKLIGALSAKHRVVLFDNRGVATSTDTPGNKLTIAEMAKDAAGLIRALHLRRADVLGWSMGGYIAQELALARPRMVRTLVLASTDFGGSRAIQPSGKVIRQLQNPKKLLGLLFPRNAIAAGKAWEQRIYLQAKRLGMLPYLRASLSIIHKQTQAAGPGWEAPRHGSYNRLPRLGVRTLVAAGTEDVIVPVRNAGLLHGRIRNSKLVLYAGAGHGFLLQSPLAVARRITDFLG
jgi:pimeloyl-ACP methyl ester carboxylesterase